MASTGIQLQAPRILSITTPLNAERISVRHPGYPDSGAKNELLILPANDTPDGGLHHGTVWLSCAIIAGNAWTGYLTGNRGGQRLQLGYDDPLPKGTYYFCVPGTGGTKGDDSWRYPVVPTFDHWPFPHDNLPPEWRPRPSTTSGGRLPIPAPSNMTGYIKMRDQHCQITSDRDHIERAHLCPREETAWFRANNMRRYNRNQALVETYLLDDGSNGLALRPDLHDEFDDAGFVFTRKQQQWVVHFLRETYNLGPTYHNSTVHLKEEISPQFLLTRFAWAIFPLVRTFVDLGPKRSVYLRAGADDDETSVVKELDIEAIKNVTQPPKKPRQARPGKGGGAEQTNGCESRRVKYRRRDSGFATDSRSSKSREASVSCSPCSKQRFPETSVGAELERQVVIKPPHPATWEEGLDEMKMRLLKEQRVRDPALLCCNYDEAESRVARGLPGKRKYGGAHLCMACLGDEYLDEDLPPFDNGEVIDAADQRYATASPPSQGYAAEES
ncbi:MAG: hypothetical protein Q9188_005659 [Gyalolechia gomerana]